MFSIDDDFDGDDQEFLDAAMAFDSQLPVRSNSSSKRKSFELGENKIQSSCLKRQKITIAPKNQEMHRKDSDAKLGNQDEFGDDSDWNDSVISSVLDNIDEKCKNTKENITSEQISHASQHFAPPSPNTPVLSMPNNVLTSSPTRLNPSEKYSKGDIGRQTPRSSFTFKKKSPPSSNTSVNMKQNVVSQGKSYSTPQKGLNVATHNHCITSTPVEKGRTSSKIGNGIQERVSSKLSCFRRNEDSALDSHSISTNSAIHNSNKDNVSPSETIHGPPKHVSGHSPVFSVSLSPISDKTDSGKCVSVGNKTSHSSNQTNVTGNAMKDNMIVKKSSSTATLRNASSSSVNTLRGVREKGVIPQSQPSSSTSSNFAQPTPIQTPKLSSTGYDNNPQNRNPPKYIPHQNTSSEWDTPVQKSTRSESLSSGVQSSNSGVATKGKRKRKFPGPAGVLPRLKAGQSLAEMGAIKPADSPRPIHPATTEIPCSQSCEDRFQDVQWVTMMSDLDPKAKDILEQFDVASVIRKASRKQLPRGKVPVICVMIDQVNTHNADASVLIRDPSGEMKGTIHRQLVKDYEAELQTGSVLVLRQCGVFSPSAKSHYLNITPNNLVRIYPKGSDSTSPIKINEFISDDFVIHEISPPKPVAQSPQPGQSLFSSRGVDTPLSHRSPAPFSVVGRPMQQTPRQPSPRFMQSPVMNSATSQRPSISNPGYRAQTPRIYKPPPRVMNTTINSPTPMSCKARTFTPKVSVPASQKGASVSQSYSNSSKSTFTPMTANNSTAKENNLDNIVAIASISNSYVSKVSVSNSDIPKSANALGTTNFTSRNPLGPRNQESATLSKNTLECDRPCDKQDVQSTMKGGINFSIHEDMDDLLKGLDDDIFSDM